MVTAGEPVAHAPRRIWPHVVAVAWLVGAAIGVLLPALLHGESLGSLDVLSTIGLTAHRGAVAHNIQSGDQVDAIIPWTTLAWQQIHHGHLPLWNPYNALGLPLAFNWQSAVLSPASLIGYLFPINLAYTVQVVLTLIIAGTGVYAFARTLRLTVVASVFAGSIFELSGPMLGWLGWPHAAVISWTGWLFTAALLILRGQNRFRHVVFFALVIACAVYAGQSEMLLFLGAVVALFLLVELALRTARARSLKPVARPLVDLTVGAAGGLMLGAPLLLPGIQLAKTSIRVAGGIDPAYPSKGVIGLVFQGFFGWPVAGSQWFGHFPYSELDAYVGMVALVMAVFAVIRRWRRPEVIALAVVAVVCLVIILFQPIINLLGRLPVIGATAWDRLLFPVALVLSVLAGLGLDIVVRAPARQRYRVGQWVTALFGVAAVGLGVLWISSRSHLPPSQLVIRDHSFVWPAIGAVIGVAGGLALMAAARRDAVTPVTRSVRSLFGKGLGWWLGALFLIYETAFLISAGAPLISSAPQFYKTTPPVAKLQRAVGSSLVGQGSVSCFPDPPLGILTEANIVYGVHELSAYDPLLPTAYYSAWFEATGQPGGAPLFAAYCPVVTSLKVAREYGVAYVLTDAGQRAFAGSHLVESFGGEDLYRVSRSYAATVVPLGRDGSLPADTASGVGVAVSHPSPSSWKLETPKSAGPSVLRLRLTDVPGWHATLDGHPLALGRFAGVMLQARIPAGRHTVDVTYWPAAFTVGLLLALVAILGFVGGALVIVVRRRRQASRGPHPPPAPDPMALTRLAIARARAPMIVSAPGGSVGAKGSNPPRRWVGS